MSSQVSAMPARPRRRARRAFTLVELMVSLVAGLIIAIAVIGLARAATTSFYEQARLASVEATARTAANRLRYDLTKVSFMGTGNIHLATTADVPFGHRVASQYADVGQAGSRYGNKSKDLQGIRILNREGISNAVTGGKLAPFAAAPNNTAPDAIEIGGNMTTDDWYIGRWDGPSGGSCGGGRFMVRKVADPAAERLLGDPANAASNVKNAFTPGPAGTKFWARVVDPLGCQHFVEVENATIDTDGFFINLCTATDTFSLLQPGTARAGCGATPQTDETLRISPFHRVRWRVAPLPAGAMATALEPPNALAPPDSTFMLLREFLDSAGAAVPELTQIVAEYAVDLKFGIAVDQHETPANPIGFFDLDSDVSGVGNNGFTDLWTKPASLTTLSTTTTTNPGPQRVRSVKFRVSTRAYLPDRTQPLNLAPGTPYISRYCMDPPACTRFSRVRSIVSEVALMNQARMTY